MLAFTLIFLVVPNRNVRFHHALAGAAFSALAFEISKRGFVLYVSNFPTYEKLYGALAAVPIFLVWIYVSWVVILLGASVAAALTTFNYRRADWRWNSRHYLLLAMRLVSHLWRAQVEGRGMRSAQLLEREAAATDGDLQLLLGRLQHARIVHQDESGAWHLSADLEEVTLADLYRSMPLVMPIGELDDFPEQREIDAGLRRALSEIENNAGPLMERPLKSFVRSPESGAIRNSAA
jgi:membrane protein